MRKRCNKVIMSKTSRGSQFSLGLLLLMFHLTKESSLSLIEFGSLWQLLFIRLCIFRHGHHVLFWKTFLALFGTSTQIFLVTWIYWSLFSLRSLKFVNEDVLVILWSSYLMYLNWLWSWFWDSSQNSSWMLPVTLFIIQ